MEMIKKAIAAVTQHGWASLKTISEMLKEEKEKTLNAVNQNDWIGFVVCTIQCVEKDILFMT